MRFKLILLHIYLNSTTASVNINVNYAGKQMVKPNGSYLAGEFELQKVVAGSLSVDGSLSAKGPETFGKCEFTHDCRRPENSTCNHMADASCVCNHGKCVIRGHQIFGRPGFICKTYKDCKKSGRCKGVPDSQCFCIDHGSGNQCETGNWECHENRDCTTMEKCKGKQCTCLDATCEWNCYTDDDCTNGPVPFFCDSLGWRCKCKRSLCRVEKLATQCAESSPNSIKECVVKKLCKKDQPCQCLNDYCTKPWWVKDNVNCRTTQDCTDTILDCANGSCSCSNIGTCIKKSKKYTKYG